MGRNIESQYEVNKDRRNFLKDNQVIEEVGQLNHVSEYTILIDVHFSLLKAFDFHYIIAQQQR